MANKYWQEQEKKFLKAIEDVEIPNKTLFKVDYKLVKRPDDLSAIHRDKKSPGGGCYWIWTNEPVKHSLHKHKTPDKFIKNGNRTPFFSQNILILNQEKSKSNSN